MEPHFPGSVIERRGKNAAEFFSGLFFATKGLMLSQVKEITGLDTPAIQNWVGRGWVAKPVEKRYSENHLARILIINMLRDVTRLENVAGILTYINGNADSSEDDIISEAQLYIYLCDILDVIDFDTVLSPQGTERVIKKRVQDYREPVYGAREKLVQAIRLILTYYACSLVKVRADEAYERIIGTNRQLPETVEQLPQQSGESWDEEGEDLGEGGEWV